MALTLQVTASEVPRSETLATVKSPGVSSRACAALLADGAVAGAEVAVAAAVALRADSARAPQTAAATKARAVKPIQIFLRLILQGCF